jgi:hypothetical protein
MFFTNRFPVGFHETTLAATWRCNGVGPLARGLLLTLFEHYKWRQKLCTDVVRVLQAAAAAGVGRLKQCEPRQQLVTPQPHVPVAQQAANAVHAESPSYGMRCTAAAEPWQDDARRCQLLLVGICEGRSAEVGLGTREALQETARVLAQWIA